MSKKRPAKKPQPRPAAPARPRPSRSPQGWDEILAALAEQEPQPPTDAPARPAQRQGPAPAAGPVRRQAPRPPERVDPAALPGPGGGCSGTLAEVGPNALAATYWIDTAGWAGPAGIAVRFSGRRIDAETGRLLPDSFDQVQEVAGIVPDTGRISVTARRGGIPAGPWRITATPVPARGSTARPRGLAPASTLVHTRFAPLAHGPGVRVFSWPALVGLGALAGIVVQALMLARAGLPVWGPVILSLIASLVGAVGAKAWYLGLHRMSPRQVLKAGSCIQGFLAGAFATMVAGALLMRLDPGALFDAAAPGVLLGMAIGRPGCFLTGCCYGRPTPSRLGLWSSDRTMGRRRHPVQLYEAAAALALGAATLWALLAGPPVRPGTVFVVSAMAYTIARQLLFPLRSNPHTRRGRALTVAACALVAGAAVGYAVLG